MAKRVKLTMAIIEAWDYRDGQYLSDSEVPQLKVRFSAKSKRFVVRWSSETAGKVVEKKIAPVGHISIAEARKQALKRMVEDRPRDAETLGDVFEIWKKHYAGKNCEEHNKDVERDWRNHIEPHFGKTKLAKLRHADLQDWYTAKLQEHPLTPSGKSQSEPYSPNTVGWWFSYISNLCTIARQRELMLHNPCEGLEMVTPRTRTDVFTKEDIMTLGENLNRFEDRFPVGVALLRFMMLFPCRGIEAREMEWSDLDLDRGHWTIPAERYKTDRDKVFPLGPLQIDHLRSLPRWSDTYVFRRPSTLGLGSSRLTSPGIDAAVTKNHQIAVWKKVRPKPLGAHTLRKTIGSMMLNNGVPLEAVSKLLGHSTTLVTQQAYAALAPQTARKHLDVWTKFMEDEDEEETENGPGWVLQSHAAIKAHEQNTALVDEQILRALG